MRIRCAGLVALFLFPLAAVAAERLPTGYLAPTDGTPKSLPPAESLRFRKAHTATLIVRPGEQLEATVHCMRVGQYSDPAEFVLTDRDGEVVGRGSAPVGGTDTVSVPDAAPGEYRLKVATLGNSFALSTPVKHMIHEATRTAPLTLVYTCPRLYFWVPAGARTFTVQAAGASEAEQVRVQVFRPDGSVAAEDDSVGKPGVRCPVTLAVGDGESGRAWSVRLSKAGSYLLEDMRLYLEGDASPFVTDDPARLAIPYLRLDMRSDEGQTHLSVVCDAPAALLSGSNLHFCVLPAAGGEPLVNRVFAGGVTGDAGIVLPADEFVHCRINACLKDAGGDVIARLQRTLATAYGELFQEIDHIETHAPAPVTDRDAARGYQVFRRSEPGDIRPTSFPAPGEPVASVELEATPGEFETAFFALYPLRDLGEVRIGIGDLTADDGRRIARDALDLRIVRCWPQRTDWRSSTFHVIPELMEARDSVELVKEVPQQIAVIAAVPGDAAPGIYTCPITVDTGDGAVPAAALSLRVLPYRLLTPPGITWGLYPDTARWKGWPVKTIRAQLADFADHGITSLMVYALKHADFAYADGTVTADFTELQTQIDLAREVGIAGPMVVSIQSSEWFVKNLIGAKDDAHSPEFVSAYRQILRLIGEQGQRGNWPEYCLHSVDEPSSGAKGEAAIRTLKLIKEAGFRTFNTCYGTFVRTHLDPVLDVRCYNNIGYLSLGSAEATAALRQETLAAGDTFWWYGTGCYTNRGLIQDGNMVQNRYMGGVHFLRTGATGAWAWTFMRVKGGSISDFDGQGERESKDACIAYPTPDGTGLIPAIQWEAIREGVDDYKYIYTLQQTLEKAANSSEPTHRRAAETIRAELNTRIDSLPWTSRDAQVTNGDLDALRRQVAAWTAQLVKTMQPHQE